MPDGFRSGKACATDAARIAFSAKRNEQADTVVRKSEQSFARHVIEFEPDAVGILEQDRVIARRPSVLARRADDVDAERGQECMQLVDIGTLSGAKAQVMQPDPLLLERSAAVSTEVDRLVQSRPSPARPTAT